MSNETQYFDVTRSEGGGGTITDTTFFDVVRLPAQIREESFFDVRRTVPLSNQNYSSLNINVSANTLSDTFQMSVPKGTARIGDLIKGTLLSGANAWPYDFTVSEITLRNGIAEYNGVYNSSKLQYTYYSYTQSVNARNLPDRLGVSARNIISGIAGQLGMTLVYNAWDWYFPLQKVGEKELAPNLKKGTYSIRGTYQAVITQLFGWLSMLPHINFSVTIRNGYLYVTQRGQETGNYTLQTVEFPPTVHTKRLHTEWAGSGNPNENAYVPDDDTQVPFTGTIAFGDTSLTYEDGLLVTEVRGTATTSYTYTDIKEQKYLEKKETVDDDDCSKTEYHYAELGGEVYLQREETYTGGTLVNAVPDYTDAEKTTQTHTPLGNGWYGTTVTDNDGEVESTSLSQGMPGNTVTRYMVNATQDVLNDHEFESLIIEALFRFLSPPCISTSYPVIDNATVQKLVNATDWLNNRIEETVTLVTVDKKIIDTTMTVTYNNNVYHVDSNSIVHNDKGLRQNITLKRWY